ncbi:hypothetical protein C8F04DRAFT_1184556 [Mycena alexandri]|uniref:Uncharacterized protein n=1 Tax=Mycena alexandri TaxID=1745969 RepID=A0AAD6WZ44_9AGAR|nr:hypothetical protein C8F04DRAFT_1184556 [Mycena alexandri]
MGSQNSTKLAKVNTITAPRPSVTSFTVNELQIRVFDLGTFWGMQRTVYVSARFNPPNTGTTTVVSPREPTAWGATATILIHGRLAVFCTKRDRKGSVVDGSRSQQIIDETRILVRDARSTRARAMRSLLLEGFVLTTESIYPVPTELPNPPSRLCGNAEARVYVSARFNPSTRALDTGTVAKGAHGSGSNSHNPYPWPAQNEIGRARWWTVHAHNNLTSVCYGYL